ISLTHASGAIPPGTIGNNKKVVANVIESAGMEALYTIDEPTAAAAVLNLQTGAVVDVGGGTTGISVFENGEVIYTADEPTGGTHMTLLFTVSVLTTSIIASPAMASAYEESHNVSTIYTSPLDTPHVGDTKITGKTTPLSSFSIAIYTSEGRLTGTFFGTTNTDVTYSVDLSDF
ncbi:rod shape-determining protein, partial [Listeria monocytogenes]|uniref:rod shape-determining protein n=1 Tax=Listeria monocytogenes TaxID=1639 RepID=UPI003204872A